MSASSSIVERSPGPQTAPFLRGFGIEQPSAAVWKPPSPWRAVLKLLAIDPKLFLKEPLCRTGFCLVFCC
jgi:hypothetical protein